MILQLARLLKTFRLVIRRLFFIPLNFEGHPVKYENTIHFVSITASYYGGREGALIMYIFFFKIF